MSTIAVKKVKLGDNADPSKNFLIEVPAVADGTLTIKRENGTNVLSIDATGKAVIPGVVGTVAQVGGIPTGQIVERGSNTNGEYVRFADGTQICYQLLASSSAGAVVWNFPAVFASATIRFAFTAQDANVTAPSANAVVVTSEGVPLAGSIAISAFNHLNARVNAINLRGMAIGRWF